MKLTIILALIFVASIGMAQKKTDNTSQKVARNTSPISNYDKWNIIADTKPDTIPVIAFCLDTATLETRYRKIYAIYGFSKPCINFNGLIVYQEYLDSDKKPITQYKVIYAVKR